MQYDNILLQNDTDVGCTHQTPRQDFACTHTNCSKEDRTRQCNNISLHASHSDNPPQSKWKSDGRSGAYCTANRCKTSRCPHVDPACRHTPSLSAEAVHHLLLHNKKLSGTASIWVNTFFPACASM